MKKIIYIEHASLGFTYNFMYANKGTEYWYNEQYVVASTEIIKPIAFQLRQFYLFFIYVFIDYFIDILLQR